jgi:glycosyltransferase involved in cell wall biosynthesis
MPTDVLNRRTPLSNRPVRVACIGGHPVQWAVPLLRRISREPDIELTAFYSSDFSLRGSVDPGFGRAIQWDVPLLEGYRYEFFPRIWDSGRVGFARPLTWGVFRRLRQGRFDVVWVGGYNRLYSLQAIFSAALLRLPLMIRSDSNLFSPERSPRTRAAKAVLAPLLRPFISLALSCGVVNTEYWQHYFGKKFPVFTVPFCVDNEFFRQRALEAAPRREQLRRELGLEPGRPIVLYASKFHYWKGCMDLVEAYIRLSPAPGVDPNAYLLMVGDGPARQDLEARVKESGLSSIRFLGFRNQTELPPIFDLCDVFVLPSHGEPWGLIVNEVMNAGRPIIVSDRVGCRPDLVHDGLNGLSFPARDVEALSQCLRRLIGDPALRVSMGENSLRIIQNHSFEQDVVGFRQALAWAVPGFTA